MLEENKNTLLKANEAITQGNHEAFLEFCTEDTQWTFVGDTVLEGKEAVRQWMKGAYKETPVFDVKNLIAEGDFVTAVGKISMKNEEGASIAYEYCDIWRFREGKMAELRAFLLEP